MFPKYKEEIIGSSKTKNELRIITEQDKEEEKKITIIYNGKVIKKEIVKMLSHEKQLDKLLKLGLKIHPLEEDNCWGIFASTPAKAAHRFALIQHFFPKTINIKLESNLEGDFGVDLYGKL